MEAAAFEKGNVARQLNQMRRINFIPQDVSWDMVTMPVFIDKDLAGIPSIKIAPDKINPIFG